MVLPLKPLLYEQFGDLFADNFSIYTLSKPELFYIEEFNKTNWFSQNLSVTRLTTHNNLVSYFSGGLRRKLFTFETIIAEIVERTQMDVASPNMESQKEIEFHKEVHSKSHIFYANILSLGADQFRKKHSNREYANSDFEYRFGLFREFFKTVITTIEKKTLLSEVHNCNKTALVLTSNQAESFARLLTPGKGNAGKKKYFPQYLEIQIEGLMTPAFLSRLARIKESGIVEWWTNVTEYISLVQIHNDSASYLQREEHPTGASIDGNIIVIFTLMMGGLALAMLGFFFEVIFYATQRLSTSIRHVI